MVKLSEIVATQQPQQPTPPPAPAPTTAPVKLSSLMQPKPSGPSAVTRVVDAATNAPFQTIATITDLPADVAMLGGVVKGVGQAIIEDPANLPPERRDAGFWKRAAYNIAFDDEGEESGAMKLSDALRDASTFVARATTRVVAPVVAPLAVAHGVLGSADTMTRDFDAEKGEPGYQSAMDDAIGLIGSAVIPTPNKMQAVIKGGAAIPRLFKQGAELLTPLTLPYTRGNVAANIGVGMGVDTGLRAATGSDTVFDEINAFVDGNREDKEMVSLAGMRTSGVPGYDTEAVAAADTRLGDDTSDGGGLGASLGQAAAVGGATAAGGVGAVLGAGALGSALMGRSKPLKELAESARSAATELESSIFDSERRLIEGVRKEHGDQAANTMETVLRTRVRNGTNNRINNAINRGELSSDGTLNMHAPTLMRDIYNTMTPEQQTLFNDAVNGGHAIRMMDDYRDEVQKTVAKGDKASIKGIEHINAPEKLYAAFGSRIRRAHQDAKVNQLLIMYKQATDQMTRYASEKAGLIDKETAASLRKSRFYVPRQSADDEGFFDKAVDALRNTFTSNAKTTLAEYKVPYFRGREYTKESVNDVLNAVLYRKGTDKVFDQFDRYVTTMMQYGEDNSARREVIDAIMRGKEPTSTVTRVTHGEGHHGQIIPIWRDGKTEYYSVSDRGMHTSLQFNPPKAMPLMTSMKQLSQMSMTGVLEPLFVIKSLIYDMGFGVLSQRVTEGVSGPLDSLLARNLQRRVNSGQMTQAMADGIRSWMAGPVRLSELPVVVARGMWERASGAMAEESARLLQQRLAAVIGDPALQPAAQKAYYDAMDKFNKTKYAMLSRQGYTSQSIQHDMQAFTALEEYGRKIANTKAGRYYRHALDTVREGYRMGLATQQMAHMEKMLGAPLRDVDYAVIARNTRAAGSDPTRMGSNMAVQLASSTVPYANTALQSMLHLFKSLSNPAFYSVAGMALTLRMAHQALIESALPPDEVAKLRESTGTYKQANNMPMLSAQALHRLYTDGLPSTADDVVWVPMGPEMGNLTYAAETVARGLLGMNTPHEVEADDAVKSSLLNLGNIMLPPAINMVLAAVGKQPIDPMMTDEGIRMRRDPLTGGYPDVALGGDQRGLGLNSGVMTDKVANMLDAALSGVGTTLADILETTIDTPTNHDEGFFEGMQKALGIVKYNHVDKFLPKGLPFFNATQRDSSGTPLSDQFYRVDNFFTALNSVDDVQAFGATGQIADPVFLGPMTANKIQDRDTRAQAQQVAIFFSSPYRKAAIKNIGRLRRVMRTNINNPAEPPDMRAATFNRYNDQIQDEYRKLLDGWAEKEKQMKAQYGDDWSIEKLTRDIRHDVAGFGRSN